MVTSFADILNAVDEVACNALLTELVGDFHLQSHCHRAVACHKPSGNILGMDVDVGDFDGHILAVEPERDAAVAFDLRYLLLCESVDGRCGCLHLLAELRTEFLEVGFDRFHQHAVAVIGELHLLDIDFGEDKLLHGFELASAAF